eukprot:TRINITY_DN7250_c0_g5_i1.p1 TRINITY_DN7250_c0_g5~~TRINITY_DN7250_c0_g5_i1.p1  ORF type:complete len:555 (-),score=90.52 TRINITY_DN7250_c0_g5_i1:61-1725(-)
MHLHRRWALSAIAIVLSMTSASASFTRSVVGDDWDALYSVMETTLGVMDGMDQQWTALMGNTISQIGVMANRIVATEVLINDEGLQIGEMADRIVATEYILSNLTARCLHCTHTPYIPTSRLESLAVDWPTSAPALSVEFDSPSCFTCELAHTKVSLMGANRSVGGLRGEDPVAGLLALMNHTLILMEGMSAQVTGEMQLVEQQIGVMADRIVGTECLIMNMSDQIGVMAGRMVYTERMISNVSAACCNAGTRAPSSLPLRVRNPPPPACNGTSPHDLGAAAVGEPVGFPALRSQLRQVVVGNGCAPWDAVCLAIKTMTAMAEKMEDVMYSMCSQMLNQTAAAALEVGSLADQIVGMEHQIVHMGMLIGQIADDIITVESTMLGYAQSFCSLGAPVQARAVPPPGPSPPTGRASRQTHVQSVAASVGRLRSIFKQAQALQDRSARSLEDMTAALQEMPGVVEAVLKGQPRATLVVNPLKWMKLMSQMMTEMTAMSGRMMRNMAQMAKGISDMSIRVLETSHLILQMGQQIQTMSDRMAATMSLVEALVKDCRPI